MFLTWLAAVLGGSAVLAALVLRGPTSIPRRAGVGALASALALAATIAGAVGCRRDVLERAPPPSARTLWLLLDVSRSMLARDAAPDRLARGKEILEQLLEENPRWSVAIVAFAAQPVLVCPATRDRVALASLVEGLSIASAPGGGSRPAAALAWLGERVRPGDAVVLVSDGGHGDPSDMSKVPDFGDRGVGCLIVGVGDPSRESAAYDPDTGAALLERGRPILTRRADDRLAELAVAAGGTYRPYDGGSSAASIVPADPLASNSRVNVTEILLAAALAIGCAATALEGRRRWI